MSKINELFPHTAWPEFDQKMDRFILTKIVEFMSKKDNMDYRDRGDWSGTFESNLDNGRWVKYDYVENLLKEKDEQIKKLSLKLEEWENCADRLYYYAVTHPIPHKYPQVRIDRDKDIEEYKRLKGS